MITHNNPVSLITKAKDQERWGDGDFQVLCHRHRSFGRIWRQPLFSSPEKRWIRQTKVAIDKGDIDFVCRSAVCLLNVTRPATRPYGLKVSRYDWSERSTRSTSCLVC